MKVVLILIGITLFLWFVSALIIFIFIFHRMPDLKDLNQVDLTGTSYEPYAEELNIVINKARRLDFHERFLLSRDHLRLFGLYLDKGSHKTVMFVSGYQASPFSNFSYQMELFLKEGYNILLTFPRAHGPSEGMVTTFGIKESLDVADWANKVALASPNVEELVIYGTSMGGFAVSLASAELSDPRIRTLVVDCAFDSLEEMLAEHFEEAKCHYPTFMPPFWLIYRIVCGVNYRRVKASCALAKTTVPVFFIHGTDDKTIRFRHGVANAEACRSEHDTCFVEGGAHTISLMQGAPDSVNELFRFIHKFVR